MRLRAFGPGRPAGPVVDLAMTGGRHPNGDAPPHGRWNTDVWWWVPIALTAWFAVAVAVGFWLGPVLRRWSQAREAAEPHSQMPAGGEKPVDNGERAA